MFHLRQLLTHTTRTALLCMHYINCSLCILLEGVCTYVCVCVVSTFAPQLLQVYRFAGRAVLQVCYVLITDEAVYILEDSECSCVDYTCVYVVCSEVGAVLPSVTCAALSSALR